MLVLKRLSLILLNIVILWTFRVVLGGHNTRPRKTWIIFRLRLLKSIPTKKNNVVPTICGIKNPISQISHQKFVRVSLAILWHMEKKYLMKGLPTKLTEFEEPWTIRLSTKATKIIRGPSIDVSKFAPGLMLQMDSALFNVESIRELTLTFVDIWSDT